MSTDTTTSCSGDEQRSNAIVSACLLGLNCRYDGNSALNERVFRFLEGNKLNLIPVCPEQLAGFPTPRKKCEIKDGDGFDVVDGRARVFTEDGEDVTELFIRGAEETFRIARIVKAKVAVLKSFSPSCGAGRIYDGSFSGRTKEGWGVTAAMLRRAGIVVLSDLDV
ncbi:DUF523 domain-containing protein [Archaeoglobus veneficus]|uniref:Uncharacterized protein n=1 Tax=Archaeoglobus veneficus (strain DSM 11195 / SNP6) TaxID=693661 RepID=F2KNZ3_ARCVS|nr:protein of unknown function DUF523 [Archaeoglobus veneficus SNP6]